MLRWEGLWSCILVFYVLKVIYYLTLNDMAYYSSNLQESVWIINRWTTSSSTDVHRAFPGNDGFTLKDFYMKGKHVSVCLSSSIKTRIFLDGVECSVCKITMELEVVRHFVFG